MRYFLKNTYSRTLFVILFFCVFSITHAADYRSKKASSKVSLDENPVLKLALGLGRSSEALSKKDIKRVMPSVTTIENNSVPSDLVNTWQKLLRISQGLILLENNPWFFSTGYEFETSNANVYADEDFKEGVREFKRLIKGNFGHINTRHFEDKSIVRDGNSNKWKVVTEFVRENDVEKSGWEVITPPFKRPEELEDLASLRWRLGESEFGRSNKMTGLHQTYEIIPQGESADSGLVARTAANLLLIQAQFSPAFFELFDVKRFGGPMNMFLRPVLFDHYELLKELTQIDTAQFELKDLHQLLFKKYLDLEFETQVINYYKSFGMTANDPEVKEELSFDQTKRKKYRKNWKYRDGQIKFNLAEPRNTLFEVRIGDYVSGSPERTMMQTVLYQYVLKKAYDMAKQGAIMNLDVPVREAGETENDYWNRLELNPASTKESLTRFLGLDQKPEIARFFFGKKFEVIIPPFKAKEKLSYGFEIETVEPSLVRVLIPRDPEKRENWEQMTEKGRVKLMRNLGIEFDETFSESKYRTLISEFTVDTDKFPFLSSELQLETSGNLEIKTHHRGLDSKEELVQYTRKMKRILGSGYFHLHEFFPNAMLEPFKTAKKAEKLADFFERLSLFMQLRGYAEASVKEPHHSVDSWSLDRFSNREIDLIKNHLKGKIKDISPYKKDLKYHNFGYRPVINGLDIEIRDVGEDLEYGLEQLSRVETSIVERNLGTQPYERDPELFMDFRDHQNHKKIQQYTLAGALAETRHLSLEEEHLLELMQFEIYKPSMHDYIYFDGYSGLDETASKNLDAKMVRTNFENNVAIPLLDYEHQSFLSKAEKEKIRNARNHFLADLDALLKKISSDPRYDFMKNEKNFLYLCNFLQRSTHKTKPNFDKYKNSTREKQQELLDDLTYKVRGLVVRFVLETKIDQILEKTFPDISCEVSLIQRK